MHYTNKGLYFLFFVVVFSTYLVVQVTWGQALAGQRKDLVYFGNKKAHSRVHNSAI